MQLVHSHNILFVMPIHLLSWCGVLTFLNILIEQKIGGDYERAFIADIKVNESASTCIKGNYEETIRLYMLRICNHGRFLHVENL